MRKSLALGSLLLAFPLLAIASPAHVVHTALQAEPPQLNPIKAMDMQSYFVIGHTMEGLVTTGKKGDLVAGVAEKWKIDEKGATFWLRKNAMWSDGKPVTAKDFVFAWREVVDPKVASEYAFIMYPIKNAEKINQGKLDKAQLGVVAVNDHELRVSFEKPCPYFAGLAAMGVYVPVREDFYRAKGSKFAAEPDDLLSNGPFKLVKWVHGANLTLEKNATYWNAKTVAIDRIEVPFITSDASAIYNFFKAGKIDLVERMAREQLPVAAQDRFKIRSFEEGRIMYLEFNFRAGHPTTNAKLRKAIALAYDPGEFVNKVVGIPGTKPGVALIPTTAKGLRDRFLKEHPMSAPKHDFAMAKKLAEEARKELGGKIPALHWLTTDNETGGREAEYFQQILKSRLGVDLRIDKQIPKQRYAMMAAGQFDIVSTGWGADYDDPMTYADLKASWSEANRGKYSNPAFDMQIKLAMGTTDAKKRMDAMAAAQRIALDDVAVVPLYERTQAWLASDRVSGIVRNSIGLDPDLRYATVQQ